MDAVFPGSVHFKNRRATHFQNDLVVTCGEQIADHITRRYIRLSSYIGFQFHFTPVVQTWLAVWNECTCSYTTSLLTEAHYKISAYGINSRTNCTAILNEGLFNRFEHGYAKLNSRSGVPVTRMVNQPMNTVATSIANGEVGTVTNQQYGHIVTIGEQVFDHKASRYYRGTVWISL